MNIQEIIIIIENKLTTLHDQRTIYFNSGDIGSVQKLDADILETQSTLDKLRGL